MTEYKPIAESNNFIVLDKYTKIAEQGPDTRLGALKRLKSLGTWNIRQM